MVWRGLAVAVLALVAAFPATAAKTVYEVDFESFSLAAGTHDGTSYAGALAIAAPTGTFDYADPHGHAPRTYDTATWTSAWHTTSRPFMQAVPSWNASTPPGTWVQVELRARTAEGHETKWFVLGRWAYGEDDIYRTSLGGQGDKDGFVAIDTLVPKTAMVAYQARLTLLRASGTTATPSITRFTVVASDPRKAYAPSATAMTSTIVLDVPEYSQEIHTGHYPEFDNGGEAWCSPTSTSMILGYWGKLPTAADYGWVLADDPSHVDPWVDHAARFTYDYNYDGAGNWPFNIAYAHRFGLDGFVTQLHSLAEAEAFVKAGIPLVASLSFGSGKLDGFPFKSTNGHLLTIVGFEADGDVVSNDPAALVNADVQRTYDRAQFEEAWMSSTGGLVYVMWDPAQATLPPSPRGNW